MTAKKTAQTVPQNAEDIAPLLIGEDLPKATLKTADGKDVQLSTILKQKPTVLVFYRGGWCPYCNLQLSGLAEIEKGAIAMGYQIVAISPDDYQNLAITEEKDSIQYQLFSDPEAKLIQEVGIGFQTPLMLKGYIATQKNKGETSEIMPVPSVMIVDTEGEILFEYINPNYKVRLSSELLLSSLQVLKEN